MLAMADKHGHVAASVPGLATRARVSLEKTIAALARLSEPDEWSRSKEFDGRRIDVEAGGWVIINYTKYAKIRDEEERKEYMRNYMRKRRKQDVSKVSSVNRSKPGLAHTDAYTDFKAVEGLKAETTKNKILEGGGFVENRPPDNMPALNYAIKIIEDLGMTETMPNKLVVVAAVKALVKSGKSGPAAYEFLLAQAKDAIDRGDAVDKFWFEDSKWRRNGKRLSKREQEFAEARRRCEETD
jgi:hypothetical protein